MKEASGFGCFFVAVVFPDYYFEFLTRFPFLDSLFDETSKDLSEAGFLTNLDLVSGLKMNFRPSKVARLLVVDIGIGGGVILLPDQVFEGNEYLDDPKFVLLY